MLNNLLCYLACNII